MMSKYQKGRHYESILFHQIRGKNGMVFEIVYNTISKFAFISSCFRVVLYIFYALGECAAAQSASEDGGDSVYGYRTGCDSIFYHFVSGNRDVAYI